MCNRESTLEDEKTVAKLLKKNPAIAAHVVDVLDTSSNHIVMSYVDTPIKKDKCLQNPLEVFVDYVKTLDAMYEASDTLSQAQGTETTTTPSLVFMDATFKNFGYEPDGGKPRLIDLGAFHVTRDDRMDSFRPSFVPPQMWSKNAQSEAGSFCTIYDSEYTVEELRAVGYYACLYEVTGWLFKEHPEVNKARFFWKMPHPSRALHTCTILDSWSSDLRRRNQLPKLTDALKSFEQILSEAASACPADKRAHVVKMKEFLLRCIKAPLMSLDSKEPGVIDVVREAAAWARETLLSSQEAIAVAEPEPAVAEPEPAVAEPEPAVAEPDSGGAWADEKKFNGKLLTADQLKRHFGGTVRVRVVLGQGEKLAFRAKLGAQNPKRPTVTFDRVSDCCKFANNAWREKKESWMMSHVVQKNHLTLARDWDSLSRREPFRSAVIELVVS
jgi:hypothetical protein